VNNGITLFVPWIENTNAAGGREARYKRSLSACSLDINGIRGNMEGYSKFLIKYL
jgi:hypothetical protein